MKINRTIALSAAGIVAAGIGTYLFLRRKARSAQSGKQDLANNAQTMIRHVMHKAKGEPQAV